MWKDLTEVVQMGIQSFLQKAAKIWAVILIIFRKQYRTVSTYLTALNQILNAIGSYLFYH